MNYGTYIFFVDTHSESARAAEDCARVGEEPGFKRDFFVFLKTGVIEADIRIFERFP